MAPMDELLQKGIQAAKSGRSAEARHILKQVTGQDPRHETAWLWLSGVVETDEQRLTCLENVLAINPHNQAAQRGLALLRQKAAAIKPLPEATPKPPQVITVPPPPPSPLIMSRPRARKWYRQGWFLLLTFFFCTPLWALIVLTDRNQGTAVKVLAGIVLVAYVVFVCPVITVEVIAPLMSQDGSRSPAIPVSKPTPTIVSTLISKIETANGYDWRTATETDKIELCKWIDANWQATMGSSVGWRFLFDNLNEFYRTDEPFVLQQKITEIAAVLALYSDIDTDQLTGPQLVLLSVQIDRSGGYFVFQGEVKNIFTVSLENVTAVVSIYDDNRKFITSDDALIEYTTLLPGQTSPFEVMVDYNPKMEYYKVEFKHLLGGTIPTRNDAKSD